MAIVFGNNDWAEAWLNADRDLGQAWSNAGQEANDCCEAVAMTAPTNRPEGIKIAQ